MSNFIPKSNQTDSFENVLEELSQLVTHQTGVQLGPKQKPMVKSRLSKRMIDLRISNPDEYLDYFKQNKTQEMTNLISILTTHHTYFFREFSHFEFLQTRGIKELTDQIRAEGRKTLKIWSAACSLGQEVYSLSMHLNHHLKQIAPDFSYHILGTDVDNECIKTAKNGVYKWSELKEAPAYLISNHWIRGTGAISAFIKAKPSIKAQTEFKALNLIKLDAEPVIEKYDIIFCRNVLIYFNQNQIQQVIGEFIKRLNPHGYLILGISESILGYDFPVESLGSSIYSLKSKPKTKSNVIPLHPSSAKTTATTSSPTPYELPKEKIKVLCVDDSPLILTLLKKILTQDAGFEIVATAKNGLEAAEALKKHKIDVITLDIHMPEQTGLEFLQTSYKKGIHPPVVMVTSVSREDSSLGIKCLEAGARDFVEKPELSNLAEKTDELRTKLRCAALMRSEETKGMLQLTKSFSKPSVILNQEKKIRVIVASLSDREKAAKLLREFKPPQVPTIVLFQGGENLLTGLIPTLASPTWKEIKVLESGSLHHFKPGNLLVGDFHKNWEEVKKFLSGKRSSFMVIGVMVNDVSQKIAGTQINQLILEEGASGFSEPQKKLFSKATELLPVTSFAYVSDHFLSIDI